MSISTLVASTYICRKRKLCHSGYLRPFCPIFWDCWFHVIYSQFKSVSEHLPHNRISSNFGQGKPFSDEVCWKGWPNVSQSVCFLVVECMCRILYVKYFMFAPSHVLWDQFTEALVVLWELLLHFVNSFLFLWWRCTHSIHFITQLERIDCTVLDAPVWLS